MWGFKPMDLPSCQPTGAILPPNPLCAAWRRCQNGVHEVTCHGEAMNPYPQGLTPLAQPVEQRYCAFSWTPMIAYTRGHCAPAPGVWTAQIPRATALHQCHSNVVGGKLFNLKRRKTPLHLLFTAHSCFPSLPGTLGSLVLRVFWKHLSICSFAFCQHGLSVVICIT